MNRLCSIACPCAPRHTRRDATCVVAEGVVLPRARFREGSREARSAHLRARRPADAPLLLDWVAGALVAMARDAEHGPGEVAEARSVWMVAVIGADGAGLVVAEWDLQGEWRRPDCSHGGVGAEARLVDPRDHRRP